MSVIFHTEYATSESKFRFRTNDRITRVWHSTAMNGSCRRPSIKSSLEAGTIFLLHHDLSKYINMCTDASDPDLQAEKMSVNDAGKRWGYVFGVNTCVDVDQKHAQQPWKIC
eukprot:1383225-Amorphochlora_amoeboformis.AAC.1